MKKISNINKRFDIIKRNINQHQLLVNSQKTEIINSVLEFADTIIEAIIKKKKY